MKKLCFSRVAAGGGVLAALVAVTFPFPGLAQFKDPIFDVMLGPPVRIVSPPNHAVFYSPVDIPIFVYTRAEARFTNVELYASGTDLGSAANLASTNRPISYFSYSGPTPTWGPRLQAVWCLVWSNVPAGAYALTAVGNGNELLVPTLPVNRTSAPVNIAILTSTNDTNPTNVVSILATDPIAVAGTNTFWTWPGMTNPVPSWTNWPPPRWGYFTNWGPKTALFTVRRFGDASSALTVNYKIGGTASNGVDYVTLPGFVDIPAGGGYGLIPIVPIDNGSNNIPKTVVLSLAPPTNTPPDYLVGYPPRAEAVIYYRWPRPIPLLLAGVLAGGSVLSDGSFHLDTGGPDGAWFAVQNSTALLNWSSVSTNQVVQGSIDFVDPDAASNPAGFYRVVPLTNSPAQ
jgi:hypothetical protein